MKSLKVFFIFCFVAISFSAFSQINFGVRGGVNLASQTSEALGISQSSDNIIGLTVGALVNVGITDDFSIQPELNYIQKGAKYDIDLSTIGGDNLELEQTLNYLEIPVLAKYGFGGSKIGGFIQAGPSIGFGLSGSASENGEPFDFTWEDTRRSDFSIQFGAGLNFGSLFLDARYGLGLTNLADTDDDITATNRGINIGLGYMF